MLSCSTKLIDKTCGFYQIARREFLKAGATNKNIRIAKEPIAWAPLKEDACSLPEANTDCDKASNTIIADALKPFF